jgi:uncharacterized membrane protein
MEPRWKQRPSPEDDIVTRQELDEAEWSDSRNWRGVLYFAARDSRSFVPKRSPGVGITVNLARPVGLAFFLAVVVLLGWVLARVLNLV